MQVLGRAVVNPSPGGRKVRTSSELRVAHVLVCIVSFASNPASDACLTSRPLGKFLDLTKSLFPPLTDKENTVSLLANCR